MGGGHRLLPGPPGGLDGGPEALTVNTPLLQHQAPLHTLWHKHDQLIHISHTQANKLTNKRTHTLTENCICQTIIVLRSPHCNCHLMCTFIITNSTCNFLITDSPNEGHDISMNIITEISFLISLVKCSMFFYFTFLCSTISHNCHGSHLKTHPCCSSSL